MRTVGIQLLDSRQAVRRHVDDRRARTERRTLGTDLERLDVQLFRVLELARDQDFHPVVGPDGGGVRTDQREDETTGRRERDLHGRIIVHDVLHGPDDGVACRGGLHGGRDGGCGRAVGLPVTGGEQHGDGDGGETTGAEHGDLHEGN